MKIKAVILAFIFLFGGSGLSVDIAQCCDEFSGIGLSLNAQQPKEEKECCLCIKAVKKKGCCDDITIQTVINPVLGLQKAGNLELKQFSFKVFQHVEQLEFTAPSFVQIAFLGDDFHHHDPVPVLIKKRVLQI